MICFCRTRAPAWSPGAIRERWVYVVSKPDRGRRGTWMPWPPFHAEGATQPSGTRRTGVPPGACAGVKLQVPEKPPDRAEPEPRRLAGPIDRVEPRAMPCAAHALDPNLGDGLGPSDAPAAVRRTGGEGEPRARFVADLDRLVPKIPGDLDRGAGTESSHVRAVSPELRGEQGGGTRLEACAHERARERIPRFHLGAANRRGKRGTRDDGGRCRRREPSGRPRRAGPEIEIRRHGEPRGGRGGRG